MFEAGGCMDIRQKRLMIIVIVIFWGYLSASLFFFGSWGDWMKNDFLSYFVIVFYFSTMLTEYIFKAMGIYSPYWLAVGIYFAIQFVIYYIVGIILSRFIFPDKKL
jgi:predicted Na+-dependent transporter